MAFNVNLYAFSKRERSTAAPSGSGLTVSCHANEELDILAPVIVLDWRQEQSAPTGYNYARISDFGRWYWITGWRNEGGVWIASLQVDALASWAQALGSQRLYVYRSSSAYNLKVSDDLYPTTAQRNYINVPLPKPWTIGGASASGDAANTGVIVLGILSGDGVSYYGFTPNNLASFMDYLFSPQYYNTVLGEFGALEYPEAKVAVNPMQYITSAKFIPMGVTTPAYQGFQPWTLHASTIYGVNVGTIRLANQEAYAFFEIAGTPIQYHTTTSYQDIEITSDMLHPQADERGDWLNMPPYTTVELYYPPFGIVPLDAAAIYNAETIRIRLTVDVWTATGVLDVILDPGTVREQIITRLSGVVGADVPLANILVTGHSQLELYSSALGGLAAAGSLAAGNAGGAAAIFGAANAAVGTVVQGMIPHLSTVGGQGSTAQLEGVPRLMISRWLQAPDDLDGHGRPLCDMRVLSAIPGFIMADAEELSLPCTTAELETIKAAVAGGFWYGV